MTRETIKKQGFTLIELLVVIAIMAVLTSLGIASYSTYNNAQVLQTTAADVVNLLNTAKSQSISQVKPSSCASSSLSGYKVDIDSVQQQYTLSAVCTDQTVFVTTEPLPNQVNFDSSSIPTIFFAISTGTVSSAGTIIISGYGKTKTITVSTTGNISVN